MGGWLRPRKNPFQAQGLEPGTNLRLELQIGDRPETLVTTVEAVDTQEISVLVPVAHQRRRHVPYGALVHAEYTRGRQRYRFVAEGLGPATDGNLDRLSTPARIEVSDRRRSFRLDTIMRPSSIYRVVIDPTGETPHELYGCTVVDISEGGVRLSSRTPASAGELLGLDILLPESERLVARMKVISAHEPPGGRLNWRIHCEFAQLGHQDRDAIARVLLQRQRRLLREGRL